MIKQSKKLKFLAQKIARKYKPEKVILFGSYAWGVPTADSDVDLLIIKNTKKPAFTRELEVRKSLAGFDIPAMDVLVYTPAEIQKKITKDRNLFIEDIVNNGVMLYEAN